MRTHNIPSRSRIPKRFLFYPPDLALLLTLIGSNYPCLELIFMVLKVFEPLKFNCISMSIRPLGKVVSMLGELLFLFFQKNLCYDPSI